MSGIGISSRGFQWSDLPGLHDLVVRSWSARGTRSPIHLGDLYWMLRSSPNFEPERDIRLWKDRAGRTVGAAWFTSWAKGEVLTEPADLATEGLEWLEATHRTSEWGEEYPHFSFEAWEDDARWSRVLREHGYLPGVRWGVRLARAVDRSSIVSLPPGFHFVPVTGERHMLEHRAAVMRSAFAGSTASAETWEGLRSGGGYRPDLDVFLVDGAGEGAAAALCWYDDVNRCGQFEPVGTAQRYRGLGLGKAVMAEGLRRLAAAGATLAIVGAEANNTAAVRLYESAGFETVGFLTLWRKEFQH